MPTAFYRHFDSIESLGLALVDESFVSLRAMLRDIRRGDPSVSSDIVDRSVETLVEHVHQQRSHFLFIARERAAGPPSVREAIRHEIELCERELATDLARLPGTESWSAEDLRVLSNLIVTAMVATAEQIMVAVGRPERREADRRERPHPAPDGPGRRPQLAVTELKRLRRGSFPRALSDDLLCGSRSAPGARGRRSDVTEREGADMGRARTTTSTRSTASLVPAHGARRRPRRRCRRGAGGIDPARRAATRRSAAPRSRRPCSRARRASTATARSWSAPASPTWCAASSMKHVRAPWTRPPPRHHRARPAHRHAPDGHPVAGPRGVPRPARRPRLAVRGRAPVPGRLPGPGHAHARTSPRPRCGRCAGSGAAR